jgi:DNA-binding response OmpR family regulator
LTGEPSEVMDLIKTKQPELVLLDLRLPGVSGVDVLKEIRGVSKVPVVFLTANERNADIEQAL